mmetsp:Transcript_107597/g.347221  ORF Transcript_107597/g.347221 Transcript_107597/m.347221 type:complete len:822 (+) Transcript_107597:3-2468(+)
MTDGPSGARGPVPGVPAASVPCGIALGATWDPELCREVGAILGQETKAKGAAVLLGPTVNLHRQPLGGRHFECLSEDPQLTALLAVDYIRGVQGEGVACCVKHYCCNDQEHRRDYISAEVSERTLREVYLPPFEAAVREGDSMTVMTGYNRVNGTFCSENRFLLQDVLRGEWGFKGCVISDWTGTHSLWGNLEAGMDIEMPEAPGMYYSHRMARLFHGDLEGLQRMVRPRALGVLRVMARLGLIPAPGAEEPRVSPKPPGPSPNSGEMRSALARAAAEAAVLLKNGTPSSAQAPVLPLQGGARRPGAVAVLGPTAKRLTTQGGGSASVLENQGGWDLVAALQRRMGEAAVVHARGTDAMTRYLTPPGPEDLRAPGGKGMLDVEFVSGSSWDEWPGDRPTTAAASPVRVLDHGFFTGIFYNQDPPSRKFQAKGPWSARYRGLLVARSSGRHELSVAGTGSFRLSVGGKEVLVATGSGESLEMGGFLGDLGSESRTDVQLTAGQPMELCIEWRPGPLRPSRLHLGFRQKPWANEAELHEEAVRLAQASEVAVVVLGTVVNGESEGRDQDTFEQGGLELVERVAAVQPRTVLCMNVGSPKRLPPELVERTAGLMVCWLAGQEAGEGLAAALCGEGWGPCGRLPTTWPVRLEDGPTRGKSGLQYPGLGTQVVYSEGVLVGHRWFDSQGIAPLFCFGHGLSYARFELGRLEGLEGRLERPYTADEMAEARVAVRNVGSCRGKEVVQLFVERREPGASRPWRLLLGFAKLALEPGEEKTAVVRFQAAKAAQYWDEGWKAWALQRGPLEVLAAASGAEFSRARISVAG